MPLRHSYAVELRRVQGDIKRLELDLARNPQNVRAALKIRKLEKEERWYTMRIAQGADPGARVI